MFTYACMLLDGKGVESNEDEGIRYLKMAAENDNIDALIKLKRIKIEKIKNAIKKSDTKAMIKLAHMYLYGKIVKKNINLAFKYLKMACDLNDDEAKIELKKLKKSNLLKSVDMDEMDTEEEEEEEIYLEEEANTEEVEDEDDDDDNIDDLNDDNDDFDE